MHHCGGKKYYFLPNGLTEGVKMGASSTSGNSNLNGNNKKTADANLTERSPMASITHDISEPANATPKKTAVSKIDAKMEANNGARHQTIWRKRLKTTMSNNCEQMNAKPDAQAILKGATNADATTAMAKPTHATRLAARGPARRLVKSETKNAKG
jgi:hypothetical protein